jgi:hypothetical protein
MSCSLRGRFADGLLLAVGLIERVSILPGHQSIRITENHYAPWMRSRQEKLEADLTSAWSRDPFALSGDEGTLVVRGKPDHAN